MAPAIYVIPAAIVVGVLVMMFWMALRAYLNLSGIRLVTCPETKTFSAVQLDAKRAVLGAFIGTRNLRLKDCRRWRERGPCGQACLREIEAAPDGCLVRSLLERWYEKKSCILCAKPFGEIHWLDHKPALMSPERVTLEWNAIPVEKVPEVLASHRPVCWNCHIAETFRRRYPDLVVDRPWRPGESHRIA